jgi:hypothetical protein
MAKSSSPATEKLEMPTPSQLEAQGFTSLFNSKDLSGWVVPEGDNGHWKAVDGVIDYDACSEAKGNKSLFTEKEYGDYTIYFEWRFKRTSGLYSMPTILPDGSYKTDEDGQRITTPTPNADSGLLFRPGHQANLWCWPCGSGELWMVRNNKNASAEQRAAAVPKVCADKPVGEWNRMMATVVGDRVSIILNGYQVIDNAQLPNLKKKSGPIGFQHHGGPLSKKQIDSMRKRGMDVDSDAMSPASSLIQFRNIYIKSLNVPAEDSADDGWETLFDGSHLDQWTMGPERSWVVQDGLITLNREFDGKEHNLDYLWTKQQYEDFILELEFKVPERANSGIFLRTSNRQDPVYTGLELQVSNSHGRTISRGGTVGAVYDLQAPTINAVRPAGQWNKYRVTCRGPNISVEVNDQLVNEVNLDNWVEPNLNPDGSKNKFPRAIKDFARVGYIGLQDHGRQVWYRNIRVKRLKMATRSTYRFEDNKHGKKLLTSDGRHLLSYMTKKPANSALTANSVCCLFPVNTPAGERMVDFAPSDHPHHRGIFLAWHAIDGPVPADFWGWGEWAPTKDRVIVNRSFTPGKVDADSAMFSVKNQWMAGDQVLVNESSSFKAREVDKVFVIDAQYCLTPTADLTLRQTAFGGFCVKARKDGQRVYLDSNGHVDLPAPHHLKPETDWPSRPWYAFQIALESGKTIGLAVVDHPGNPPSTWHNLKAISMVNPCIVAPGAFKMATDKTLTLQYRIIVFDGTTPTSAIEKLVADYRS